MVQSYRSLKKNLLPSVPGAHLGDLSSFRMSNPYSRNQVVSDSNPQRQQQQPTTSFVPTTIDEYQAMYPWTANLGYVRRTLCLLAAANEGVGKATRSSPASTEPQHWERMSWEMWLVHKAPLLCGHLHLQQCCLTLQLRLQRSSRSAKQQPLLEENSRVALLV